MRILLSCALALLLFLIGPPALKLQGLGSVPVTDVQNMPLEPRATTLASVRIPTCTGQRSTRTQPK